MAENSSSPSGLFGKVFEFLRRQIASKGDVLPQARKEFELGHLKQAEKSCMEVIDDLRRPPAPAPHHLGLVYQRAKCHAQAIECLSKAVEAEPANRLFRRDLAVAYAAAGDHQGAAACFEEALKLGPADATVHNAIGQAFLSMKQLGKASSIFVKPSRSIPDGLWHKAILEKHCSISANSKRQNSD